MKRQHIITQIILTSVLFILALVTVIPFIWMFVSSFAPNSDIVSVNGGLFPAPSTLGNYTGIQEKFDFWKAWSNIR